jgi:cysteine desulfuration protein SufE
MTLAEKQRQLHDDLAIVPDRQERLGLVVDRARRANVLSGAEKNADNRVPGCISPVWLVGEYRDGVLLLRSEAESPVVKGLVSLMCELYSGATPAEIAATEPTLFEELGLLQNLSPTRRNGLAAVRTRIRELARSFL